MLGILYLIACFLVGAGLIIFLEPYWKNRVERFLKDKKQIHPSFIFFPSSFLVGTLVLSWVTYFGAVAFQHTKKPLWFSNLLSLILALIFLSFAAYFNRSKLNKWLVEIKRYGITVRYSNTEWFILLGAVLFWSLFIFRSLYIEGNILHAGVSAFSDFGAHLPVVRSFSLGQNFPAQYPHFPDGTIRYHFMFYFLAGNLEYLGLNLAWALNLPSILSLVSFSMLLYALAVGITKKPTAGLLTCLFFAFRSSLAFFTYAKGFQRLSDFLRAVRNNLNATGTGREHIGNTMNESWGLWAQKVYINQRHLAFAFGLFFLALFLLLPLFMDTIDGLKAKNKNPIVNQKWASPTSQYWYSQLQNKNSCFYLVFCSSKLIKQLLLSKEAWLPQSVMPAVLAGLLLGLAAFWNGAVVIAGISVLFVMAALSWHKLEYLLTAVITMILSTLQSRLFVGSGTGAVSIQFKAGFLAASSKLTDIVSYYVELLGVLPFVLLGIFVVFAAKKRKWLGYMASVMFVLALIAFIPSLGMGWSGLIIALCLTFCLYITRCGCAEVQTISPWLIPVFLGPLLLATTLQLTPDITVNHKYIILAVILLNIPVSDLLASLLQKKKKASFLIVGGIIFLLTCTGLVDLVTLYNLDKNSVSYNQNEPVKLWAQNETNPKDIFLTDHNTHYGAPMSILLAGRSVYSGYPYFTWTAGYDVTPRFNNMVSIYSADDPDELQQLARHEGIRYIVIEEQNRTSAEYVLNEAIFYETFRVAFEDSERNIVIFSVQ